MRRIGAVVVQGLLLRAHVEDPSEETLPLALVDASRGRDGGPIVALSEAARADGVRLGQSRVQALARSGGLRILELEPARVRAAQDRLLQALVQISPVLEDGLAVEAAPGCGVGVVRFDAAGLGLLHPTEADLLEAVQATLQDAFGPVPPRFGAALAGGPALACVLARARPAVSERAAPGVSERAAPASARGGPAAGAVTAPAALCPPGHDRAALAALPLDHLHAPERPGLPADALEHLWLLSVRTVGGFAALPPSTVETRFGADGLALHRLARGEDPRPLRPWQPRPEGRLSTPLPRPAEALPEIEAALAPLLETLLQRLAGQNEAPTSLEVRYLPERSTDAAFVRRVGLLDPLADARAVLDLVRLDLVARPLPRAVASVEVRADRTVPRPRGQTDLFERAPRGELARAVARLRGRLGERSVGVPVLVDRHRPEAGYTLDPSLGSAGPSRAAEPSAPLPEPLASLALRLFPTPRPIAVHPDAQGRPSRVDGRPATSAGPFPMSGEWWSDPYDRRYYEVETDDAVLWIYSDGADGRWYVHGVFD